MEDYDAFYVIVSLICIAAPIIAGKFVKKKLPKDNSMLERDLLDVTVPEQEMTFDNFHNTSDEGVQVTDAVQADLAVEEDTETAGFSGDVRNGTQSRNIIDDPKKLVVYSEIMRPKFKE